MFKRKYSVVGFHLLALLIVTLSLISCSSHEKELETYYKDNVSLHTNLCDSILQFCKINKKKISINKYLNVNSSIDFGIYFADSSGYLLVEFDSLLNRHDRFPERTAQIHIPKNIIENFSRSPYFHSICDGNEIYFAYKDISSAFARDVSYLCLYVSPDTIADNKRFNKIATGVYITEHYMR